MTMQVRGAELFLAGRVKDPAVLDCAAAVDRAGGTAVIAAAVGLTDPADIAESVVDDMARIADADAVVPVPGTPPDCVEVVVARAVGTPVVPFAELGIGAGSDMPAVPLALAV